VFHVGVEILNFSAADGVEKTAPGATGRDLDVKASQVLRAAAATRIELAIRDHALVGVVLVENLEGKLLILLHQATDFKEEQDISVLVHGHLHVRGLALITFGESTAQAPNLCGKSGTFDSPTRYVNFVNALIADITIAKVPEPMPVVMDQIAVIRL